MLASGKQAQHVRGVCGIRGLAENLIIDDNYRVGSEYAIVRTLTCNRKRLLSRQAFGTVFCGFSGQRVFRSMRRLNFEWDSGVTQ